MARSARSGERKNGRPLSRSNLENSAGSGVSSPMVATAIGLSRLAMPATMALALSSAKRGAPATIEMTSEPMAGSASRCAAVRPRMVASRMLCAVTSTGFSIAANGGSTLAMPSTALRRQCRQIEPDGLGEIEGVALERARIGHHRRAVDRRLFEPHQNFGGIDQLLERLHQDDGLVRHQRRHHGVIADHGAGMAARGVLGAGAAARMHQHDRLFQLARACGKREEARGIANLLHEQDDDIGRGVVDEKPQEVFGGEVGLVAGGNDAREIELLCQQRKPQRRTHRAALGYDTGGSSLARRRQRQRFECQRDAIGEIGETDAIRPAQRQPAVASETCQCFLLGAAGRIHLGKAGGEDDRGADPTPHAGFDGVDRGLARHREHSSIDAVRQFVDAAVTAPSADLAVGPAHQMDVAA